MEDFDVQYNIIQTDKNEPIRAERASQDALPPPTLHKQTRPHAQPANVSQCSERLFIGQQSLGTQSKLCYHNSYLYIYTKKVGVVHSRSQNTKKVLDHETGEWHNNSRTVQRNTSTELLRPQSAPHPCAYHPHPVNRARHVYTRCKSDVAPAHRENTILT